MSDNGGCQRITIVMIGVLIVTLAIGLILIFTSIGGSGAAAHGATVQEPADDECLDIAVVGAGIGGSYIGWKLRERGLRISVFEYLDRVGGRILTEDFPPAPGTYLEFGAKRFRSDAHHILTATARDLGLKAIPFVLNYGNSDETIWYTRNTHMRNTDFGTSKIPYNVDPSELTDPDTLLWNMFNDNVNFSGNTYPSLEELYSLTTNDGTPVYKMTYDNFIGEYASREANRYLYETSGWADSIGPQGALHGPKVYMAFPGDTSPFVGLSTIEGGMAQVPKKLMETFQESSSKHKLHLNHQLIGIERRLSGGYNLKLRQTETKEGVTEPSQTEPFKMCAKKIILTGFRKCIERIDFPIFRENPEIMKRINSGVGIEAGRIFLAYNSQWWKTGNEDITHTRTDLPNRQTYDWHVGTNNVSILMASYHDGENVKYWRELSKFGSPIPGSLPGAYAVTDVVKERLEKYLGRIFNIKQEDIPQAVGGGMMLWDSYPFEYAWDYIEAGFDERELREFVQKPSPSDDVFIVSNSWAGGDMTGWIEGSLLAAEDVLNKYFKE